MALKRKYDTGIWMKLMVGDFLKDTMAFNTQKVGAYILLSLRYWEKGPLKNDSNTLAQITRLPIDQFNEIRSDLLELFVVKDGKLHNEALDYYREEAVEYKKKKSEAGRKAAEARWKKDKGQTNDDPDVSNDG